LRWIAPSARCWDRSADVNHAAEATEIPRRVSGLSVCVDGLFFDRRDQIFALTIRHAIPAIYERREYAVLATS
jgi:hypothetical protein